MTPVNYEATNWASLISQIRLVQLPSNSEPPLNTQGLCQARADQSSITVNTFFSIELMNNSWNSQF